MKAAWLEELAARRRFGMKPGLERIARLCDLLDHPERKLGRVIHVAGTNGKGAVAAILDAALRAGGARVARYTSPHLVRLNERFAFGGEPVGDTALEAAASRVASVAAGDPGLSELTFFEALTAVGFLVFSDFHPDWTILETGLGGRLDATNVCRPDLAVLTRIGLDHCDWLGDTIEKIAAEKAGIVKPGIPVVLGRNVPSVRAVVADAARAKGAPFVFAPDVADESELPADFSLAGSFNRENAVTALAALKVLPSVLRPSSFDLQPCLRGFAQARWPGRFQRVGDVLVDGAHNPPAAEALAAALAETPEIRAGRKFVLVAGFCSDKDVSTVLATLAPRVASGIAVRTSNPRSLAAEETAARMIRAGFAAETAPSLAAALDRARSTRSPVLVAGSLFLAGEALTLLKAFPWKTDRTDPSCLLQMTNTKKRFWFFDLDGTLADTDCDIRLAWKVALKALGLERADFDEKFVTGPPIDEVVKTLFPDRFSPELVAAARREFGRAYDAGGFPNTCEYPGVLDRVKALKADGARVFIVTNKRYVGAKLIAAKFGWMNVFEGLYAGDMYVGDGGVGKLRKPELLARVIAELGAPKDECVMVGDTTSDFEAARACGISSIAVSWGYGTPQELAQADRIV